MRADILYSLDELRDEQGVRMGRSVESRGGTG